MHKFLIFGICSVLLTACNQSESSHDTVKKSIKVKTETEYHASKFSSIPKCLNRLKKDTKSDLNIVIESSNEVAGKIKNTDQPFSCKFEEQDGYVKGWYLAEVESYS